MGDTMVVLPSFITANGDCPAIVRGVENSRHTTPYTNLFTDARPA